MYGQQNKTKKCSSHLKYKIYSLDVVGIFALVTSWNNAVHSSIHSFVRYLGCVQVNVPSLTIALSISLSYLLSIRRISASPLFSSYVRL